MIELLGADFVVPFIFFLFHSSGTIGCQVLIPCEAALSDPLSHVCLVDDV